MKPRIDDDAGYRNAGDAARAAGRHAGEMWDNIWQVCDRCSAFVLDTEQHDMFHHANLHGGDVTITREVNHGEGE